MLALDATHVERDGRRLVNFASNNYLGLTHHPRVLEALRRSSAAGAGSGAAGLVTGHSVAHADAEKALAHWKGTAAAVLLPSGYQANHAVVQTFAAIGSASGRRETARRAARWDEAGGGEQGLGDAGLDDTGTDDARRGEAGGGERGNCETAGGEAGGGAASSAAGGVRFLIDKLVHASLVDAVRATGLPFRVFPHNGLGKLRRLLQESDGTLQVVITESIFSMDGDAADLAGLAAMKREHPFALVVDEAHAAGVYGEAGAGLASELGLQAAVDVSIATLSKAVGCVGGVVCGSTVFCDALVNFGRAYIFSTAVPAFVAAAAREAVEVMRDEPERRHRVRTLASRVRAVLTSAGFPIPPGDSPIVPVILGSEADALEAAAALAAEGILVPAIRPPTVPRGASRLRVTLSCQHTDAEIDHLVQSLCKIRPSTGSFA